MATYYIDPDTGSDTGNDGSILEPFATVTKGVNTIASTAGTLILVNSLNHTLPDDGDGDIRCNADIIFRNEDDDEDYTKVEITAEDVKLRQVLATSLSFKGMTFKDSVHDTRPLFVVSNAKVANFTFTGVKLVNIKGGLDGGNLFNIQSAAGGQVTFRRSIIEGCENEKTTGTNIFLGQFQRCNFTFEDSVMLNNGNLAETYNGNLFISNTDNADAVHITSRVTGSQFTGNYSRGDGGCFYFYANATAVAAATHTATVEDSLFTGCQADLKGGGFWFGLDVLGYCKASTFIDCIGGTAVGAGAFGKGTNTVQATNQHIEIEGVLCVRCTSPIYGGALTCGSGSWMVIQNLTCVDCTASLEGDSIHILERDTSATSTLTTIDDSIFVGPVTGSYHINSANNTEIDTVTDCIVQGGAAAINDSGATLTRITDETKAEALDDCFAPLVSSAAYASAARWWAAGTAPPNSAGEPYPSFDIDMGGVQGTLAPFHPANL